MNEWLMLVSLDKFKSSRASYGLKSYCYIHFSYVSNLKQILWCTFRFINIFYRILFFSIRTKRDLINVTTTKLAIAQKSLSFYVITRKFITHLMHAFHNQCVFYHVFKLNPNFICKIIMSFNRHLIGKYL